MQRCFALLVLLTALGNFAHGQKFGYVDMEFIMNKLPEYATAQAEIDKLSENWAREIQSKQAAIDGMQRELMAEEVLLTEELKRKRQQQIKEKEVEAREYNNKVFGVNGMLFTKKKELMKDVMDKVQRALDKVAAQRKLDFIFDKSSDFVVVYTNPRHDYTDYVLEELGIDLKPTANSNVKAGKQ